MAEDVAEATESLPKEAGLVGLDRPLDQLDLTKMLAESFEPQEQNSSEETSPSGDAVEEAKNWPTPLDIAQSKETADLLRKHGGKTSEELKAEGK